MYYWILLQTLRLEHQDIKHSVKGHTRKDQNQDGNFMSHGPIRGLSTSSLVVPWEVCSLHSRTEQSFLSPRTFHIGVLMKDPLINGATNNLHHWLFFSGAEGNSPKLNSVSPASQGKTKPWLGIQYSITCQCNPLIIVYLPRTK